MFREENGKLSMTRIMAFSAFIFACVLALIIVIFAIDSTNNSFGPNVLPLVYAFLAFAAGAKVTGKFAEKKQSTDNDIKMEDVQWQ